MHNIGHILGDQQVNKVYYSYLFYGCACTVCITVIIDAAEEKANSFGGPKTSGMETKHEFAEMIEKFSENCLWCKTRF